MSVDASMLDDLDFEGRFHLYDFSEISWNTRTVKLISDSLENCLKVLVEKQWTLPQFLCSKKIFHLDHECDQTQLKVSSAFESIWLVDSQNESSAWAAAQHLVGYYLHGVHLPKETISASANVVTAPISLSDLLSIEYQNLLNPPIPFFLPTELRFPSLPILTLPLLPEIALLNIPLTVDLQAIPNISQELAFWRD